MNVDYLIVSVDFKLEQGILLHTSPAMPAGAVLDTPKPFLSLAICDDVCLNLNDDESLCGISGYFPSQVSLM